MEELLGLLLFVGIFLVRTYIEKFSPKGATGTSPKPKGAPLASPKEVIQTKPEVVQKASELLRTSPVLSQKYATTSRVSAKAEALPSVDATRSSRQHSELQKAVIWKEILDRPVSLR